jgi:phosphotriesterase-related protein
MMLTAVAIHALPAAPVIETVTGPIPAADLGLTLTHEHVLVDFIGADRVSPERYDRAEVLAVAEPAVARAGIRGVRTMIECTPAYLARDPALLRELSRRTGVRIVTNTGLYGATLDKFLPPYAFTESARQLADRWIAEARSGIGDTGIKPGFIKLAVDPEPKLSAIDGKLIEAGALAHLATGLTIAVHTGRGPGIAQLDLLATHGVHPAAWIWVHAQGAPDEEVLTAAARGAWISLDGLNPRSVTRHLALLRKLREEGRLAQVLLSHDAGWFDPAKPGGGTFRDYELLFTTFLPMLRNTGFTEADVDQILVQNPADAFAIRVRQTAPSGER